MTVLFYSAAAIALLSTLLAITRVEALYGALYVATSLLAVALVFFSLGAPFVGALEIIIYAGAILVLLLFVIMLLGEKPSSIAEERRWFSPSARWLGPALLTLALVIVLVYAALTGEAGTALGSIAPRPIPSREVATALFGPYALAVELCSLLLLSGLVGAYHLGARDREEERSCR